MSKNYRKGINVPELTTTMGPCNLVCSAALLSFCIFKINGLKHMMGLNHRTYELVVGVFCVSVYTFSIDQQLPI